MPNPNVSFQGQTLVRPGPYYADNPNAVLPGSQPTTPPLIFLGFGFGGRPQVPNTYNNPQDLLKALRGGPASGYVPFLTSPSTQVAGAQQITFINVAPNTQSSYCASGAGAAAASGLINFTSADYGLPSNQLQLQIAAGTLAGKNVSLYDGYSGTGTAPGVNLGVPFQLAYTGAATGVTVAVTVSGGLATTMTLASTASGESRTINLSLYNTVTSLVNYLNGTGSYFATVLSQGDLPTSSLDAQAATGLTAPVAGVNQYVNINATLGDIVWWCNQHASGFATAALASGITSSPLLAPANIPLTFFTGATSVTPTTANYASGFNVALTIPGWTVFADNNASGIVALGNQHASSASQPNAGRWRRFFAGSSIGDSITTATQTALNQNSITTCYVYPGIYRNDFVTGVNTLYGGHYAAAAAAGMATGNAIPMPLTSKSLTANGVETTLTTAQIDQLQQSGVMVVALDVASNKIPQIVSDLTTWQNDNNPANIFTQQVACRWQLAYTLVAAARPYVGTVASSLTNINITNAVKNALNASIYSQANQNGVINSWDPSSLVVNYNGTTQTAQVSVNVVLVGQNRFITIYVPVQPLNIVTSSNQFGQTGGLPV